MIKLKTRDEIRKMKVAGQVLARILEQLMEAAVPGRTTWDLDQLAEKLLREAGAIGSFKGYRGFPASICVSINDVVVHGIPGPVKLEEGDILGIDIGAIVDGYHSDSAVTVPIGKVSPEAKELLKTTREALFVGINEARVGNRLSDISHAIQTYAESRGYSVVRDLVGHGIGTQMHEEPQVPNFGPPGKGPRLEEGMTLAIEPMLNAGKPQIETLSDHWTVVTKDRSLSAHFEHTVAITAHGPEILTLRSNEEAV